MDNSCAEEQARLLKRTTELHERPRALALHKRPYSKDEHDVLVDQLDQHQLDLADYRRRCLDSKAAPLET
jgi:hypothetical protein